MRASPDRDKAHQSAAASPAKYEPGGDETDDDETDDGETDDDETGGDEPGDDEPGGDGTGQRRRDRSAATSPAATSPAKYEAGPSPGAAGDPECRAVPHDRPMRAIPGLLLDLALPASCAGCGREGAPICFDCRPALEVRWARPAGAPIGLPVELPAPLVQLEWAAPFTGIVRDALHALKYKGERRMAEPLGQAAAERWRRAGAGGDLIVPVPVHADRARLRGYDQAVLLARVIGTSLGLPVRPILERHRRTVAQFDLDRQHRGKNVSGAFRLSRPTRTTSRPTAKPTTDTHPPDTSAPEPRGRWVILIDDVTTTGATLAACAEVLMDAGAIAVSGLTVARER